MKILKNIFIFYFSIYFIILALIKTSSTKTLSCMNGTEYLLAELGCNVTNQTNMQSCLDSQKHLVNCTLSNCSEKVDVRDICDGKIKCQGLNMCDLDCDLYYRCANNSCVKRSTVCNSMRCDGCEEDDEWSSGTGFKCDINGKKCRLPQQLLWDEIQDCDEGVDLCYSTLSTISYKSSRDIRLLPSTTFNQSLCFECLDKSIIISRKSVCDGIVDCPDLSDECMCEGKHSGLCDQIQNCVFPPGEKSDSSSELTCELNQFRCSNGSCINRTSLCDSKVDCSDALDERYEYCGSTLNCDDTNIPETSKGEKCRCPYIPYNCNNSFATVCDEFDECSGNFFDDESFFKCLSWCNNCISSSSLKIGLPPPTVCERDPRFTKQNEDNNTVYPFEYCDGVLHCVNKKDETNCPGRFPCTSRNLINIRNNLVCDGIENCDDGSDENSTICTDRFYCYSNNTGNRNKTISIEKSARCDYVINCDNAADELCCNDSRFYCENRTPLFVVKEKIFDENGDCSDNSDECFLDNTRPDVFASRHQLIESYVLRWLVWIIGITALSGNVIGISIESKKIYTMFTKKTPNSTKNYHLLLLNLALADFLMGVYLLMLGIATIIFDKNFCLQSIKWKGSAMCHLMGVLVITSSEASVIIVVVLTSYRLFAFFKPFAAATKPKSSTTLILVAMTWILSLTFALIPLSTYLEYIFTDKVILSEKSFFKDPIVEFESAKNWIKKALQFDPKFDGACSNEVYYKLQNARSWSDLEYILNKTAAASQFKPKHFFGYYGTNSPCIPELFVTRQDKFWKYSLSLTLFNLLAFIYIVCAYAIVILKFRKPTKNKFSLEEQRKKEFNKMLKKISRLVIVNFSCWVPITILVLIHFNGVEFNKMVYAVAGIVLLPINSAFDPIIYLNVADLIWRKLRNRVSGRGAMGR